jgi:hypothetical protein
MGNLPTVVPVSGGSGLASASITLLSIAQGNGNEQPPFTERPGPTDADGWPE